MRVRIPTETAIFWAVAAEKVGAVAVTEYVPTFSVGTS
jgi:hypothetical protein